MDNIGKQIVELLAWVPIVVGFSLMLFGMTNLLHEHTYYIAETLLGGLAFFLIGICVLWGAREA